jgi:hypothetical protein
MKIKRIFNFICFFVIAPIATLFSIFVPTVIIIESKTLSFLDFLGPGLGIIGLWTWLILSYRYLNKSFTLRQKSDGE